MKFLTLLCVFLSVTTGSWAQSSNCAKGPEYWCRDVSTAKDCGAVEHCQQTVWQSEQNSKKTSTTSETAQMLCNVLVHASSELLSGDSIDINSIKEYLRQDCTKLPHQHNLIQQCQMAVEIYLPDILRHITSGTELNKICYIIQGHDSSIVAIPKPKLNNLTSNQTCVLCEFIVTILKTFVSANSSSQEVTHVLEAICKEMPEVLRDECKSFVDTYGQDIIALLIREFDPEKVCILLKICHKSQNVAFLTKPNANLCGLCDYISTYLSANNPIENVCKHFSPENNLKQQCEILAHLYRPNFCSQLPLCYGDDIIQPLEQPIESPIQSAQCSLCKYVVSYIDAVIQNNKSEAAIEAALEKVCGILPPAIKAGCVTFVDSYGPLLVQLIAKYGTPELVCNALKMCHNGTQELTSSNHIQITKLSKSTVNSAQCSLCKYVVSYIDAVIQNNKSEAAIEAALEKVCGILPPSLKAGCVTFVDSYGPLLVQLIAKYGTPELVCNALKMCHNGTQTTESISQQIVKSVKKVTNGNECTLCKYILQYINVFITSNATEQELEKALEVVCSILPESYHDKCDGFVHSYGPILVELIAELDDPNVVCQWLDICPKSDKKFIQIPAVKSNKVNGLPCNLCQYAVNYLDAVLQSNTTEVKFEEALDKACKVLPKPKLQSECQTLVHLYGGDLIKFLVEYGDPKAVCQAVHLCDK